MAHSPSDRESVSSKRACLARHVLVRKLSRRLRLVATNLMFEARQEEESIMRHPDRNGALGKRTVLTVCVVLLGASLALAGSPKIARDLAGKNASVRRAFATSRMPCAFPKRMSAVC